MSNKTQKGKGVATASERKSYFVAVILIALIGVLFLWGVYLLVNEDGNNTTAQPHAKKYTGCPIKYIAPDPPQSPRDYSPSGKALVCVQLEVADTNEKRMQGLSGREVLPNDMGMLFVFDQPSEQCFWMKDMNFAIDMIFVDDTKRVIDVQEAVAPDTYPKNFCKDNTKYVIEVAAGVSRQAGVQAGQVLNFSMLD